MTYPQKTISDINSDNSVTALTGPEILIVDQGSVTKGLIANVLKTWILSTIDSETITDATTVGKNLLTATDAINARGFISAQESVSTVTQQEAEEGTVTEVRLWSPERVAQAISELETPHTIGDAVSDAIDENDIVDRFNDLLQSLRTAGIIDT